MYMCILNNLMWFWLAVMVACVIVEAVTVFSLTTVWGAISALVMIFVSRTRLPFLWQIILFLVMTILLIVFTRPFAIKKFGIGSVKTNVDSMCGQEVILVKKISAFEKGEAKAKNGVVWSAKSADDSEIKAGSVCIIVGIEGNTLCVRKK